PIANEKRDGGGLIATLDEAGIDYGLIMAGNWNRVLPPSKRPYAVNNDFVLDIVKQSEGRLFGIASADPIADPWGAAAEVERTVNDLDCRALQLSRSGRHHDPSDPACDR